MKIAFFDAKDYDIKYFNEYNNNRHEITFFKENLNLSTAHLAKGYDAICGFVNTYGDKIILEVLSKLGVKYWFQRSMGYNKIDVKKANELGIQVFRIFNYSAESIGEFAFAGLSLLNRNLLIANKRVKEYNFSLNGLDGKCIGNSVIGVIGSGKIGQTFIRIAKATGARVLVYDSFAQENFPDLANQLGIEFVSLTELLNKSDFISIHCPLFASTKYLINEAAITQMKQDVIIINTARGEILDIKAVIKGLKSGKIRGLATDVLEREEGRFYEDVSSRIDDLKQIDPDWKELIEMDNVIITSHQAFLTDLALTQIAKTTLENADAAQNGDFTNALFVMENGKIKNG
ncbi:NAD(P)-dependent oxidoreductase [Mycoplasmopsis felis]|uniref:Lactate dehydrogenase n=1 Tax=Mycoplasmopsis felis TaxID=33923 RepID=A0A809RRC5_9BACT|nr:NAD(P)-dependent oxidoreductase [Mycoplasmopsis felis]WQQ01859.1 NAD(P)-dependent oxidoreductase [Mycoplasmopsis felis]WQQ02299.1 NAD(P)-dependent oxidoreductase [Mycoplasmopsis felis]WQQ03365.1 NAD(P)-dependent oxidoreductase [Mycoplasmopsis felis]WQQ05009.1 NAD(P)-dependent oxidoreductase [Mycoplasmopsis felis]WQQ05621.1 NAD(P)-dependent oxidoreductase [Mycoplasmopsis felis]